MKHIYFTARNGRHACWLACALAAGASACDSGGETVSVAGSWAALTADAPEAASVSTRVGVGTSVWAEPTDLSTGLEPHRLHLGIGLQNRERALEPDEIKRVADAAQLVRWPDGAVVPSRVELDDGNAQEHSAGPGGTNRARVRVVPTEPLEPGWYALEAGSHVPVSRFHVGSCPIVIGLSWCDGVDVMALVYSEPVAKEANIKLLSLDENDECTHDTLRFENRHQARGVRHYFRCDFDAPQEGARIALGDVAVRSGKKLELPAATQVGERLLVDVSPQNYKAAGKCSHARIPLDAPLPVCD